MPQARISRLGILVSSSSSLLALFEKTRPRLVAIGIVSDLEQLARLYREPKPTPIPRRWCRKGTGDDRKAGASNHQRDRRPDASRKPRS